MLTHIVHGIALLWWIRRVLLLVVGIVVLRVRSSSVAATRDKPAVVGERLQALAYSALCVEVGAKEQDGDADED